MCEVDWPGITRMSATGDVDSLLQVLRTHMQDKKKHFKVLQKGLQENCLAEVR